MRVPVPVRWIVIDDRWRCQMSFARRLKIGTLLFLEAVFLAMGSITTALAQVTRTDGDGPDGDEFLGRRSGAGRRDCRWRLGHL